MYFKAWHKIANSIDTRSGRERLLITIVIVITLYMIAFHVIQPRLIELQLTAGTDIPAYQALTKKRSLAIYESVSGKNSSRTTIEQQIQQLKNQLNTNGRDLSDIFVNPRDMTAFIKTILREQKLHILRLENSPPEIISSEDKKSAAIYRHGLYLEFSGRYHDHILFLKKLENLPWNIFWSELRLHADKPGRSTVSLALYTLNFKPVWLEI